ncbi:hypothetical protein ACJ72_02912 [Emergomyces africanus]|uniref:Uncharacterized protein n=1 Tax=Emergomyces africanus TaxID=1955775 RepID=A0A1B7P134_9EURO|nr:hypothetical protein ACJ72_02912 [Emergomyces africanus]
MDPMELGAKMPSYMLLDRARWHTHHHQSIAQEVKQRQPAPEEYICDDEDLYKKMAMEYGFERIEGSVPGAVRGNWGLTRFNFDRPKHVSR